MKIQSQYENNGIKLCCVNEQINKSTIHSKLCCVQKTRNSLNSIDMFFYCDDSMEENTIFNHFYCCQN